MMQAPLLSFLIAAFVTGWTVLRARRGGRLGLDHDLSGQQKFHARAVPRIGGVGICSGLIAGTLWLWTLQPAAGHLATLLLLCSIPAFGVGLIEDLTRSVSPRRRLVAVSLAALMACYALGAQITRSDIPGLDLVLSYAIGVAVITVLAVAGTANAVNIIDGFNGLASLCVVIMLAALALVAYEVGDAAVGSLALVGIGAALGFFIWNYPSGWIFLGDGGAYVLGFYVAELSILLLARNPGVSPLFPLLVCIYPVFETVFSIYRRRFLKATHPYLADGIHLHSLIYRRLVRDARNGGRAWALTRRNSGTSPFLWLLCLLSAVPAVLFWDRSALLAVAVLVFAVSYVVLYWRIVRFKSPRWMRLLASPLGSVRNKAMVRGAPVNPARTPTGG
jgi:UDP-N-acetylmuramyl pentapeptide phosphotransferase/UDP-N-acetylglucosamine-1-phosphate transferase